MAPKRVNRTAFIVIFAVVIVLALAAIGTIIGIAVTRVRRGSRVENIPLLERASHRHDRVIPAGRVPDSALPKGVHRTIVSNHPVLDILDGFLTPAEADGIVALANGRYQRSVVVDETTGQHIHNQDRTSWSVFLDKSETPLIKAIEQRAAATAGVPEEYLERLQVVRYQPGQYYRLHHDYLTRAADEVKKNGQRTVTIFAYLNTLPEDETGGGTRFPYLEYTVRPKQGSAALWLNMTPTGQVDSRTLHAGEPVVKSTKYGLNIWFRERPQTGTNTESQPDVAPPA